MSLTKLILTPALIIGLSACTLTNKSMINEQNLQSRVEAKEFILSDDQDIQYVADLYKRGGQDAVRVVSTYTDGNADIAKKNAMSAASRLKALGVHNVSADAIAGADNTTLANFEMLQAAAHESCLPIPGKVKTVDGYGLGAYRLGCEIDNNIGKQIANTADLEGRVPDTGFYGDNDGRQAANVVDEYRKGEPNPALIGLNSSDIAESQ